MRIRENFTVICVGSCISRSPLLHDVGPVFTDELHNFRIGEK